jgi:hypothetical protein
LAGACGSGVTGDGYEARTASSAPVITTGIPTTPATTTTDPDPDRRIPGRFRSGEVDDEFEIYLDLPDGYADGGDHTYPVVYLLDADWYFDGSHWRLPEGLVGIVGDLVRRGDLPPVILVGVGYPGATQRARDFLAEPERFLGFLVRELIPVVDVRFRTDPSAGRILVGHSDGGFCTINALLSYGARPEPPFTGFVALSGDYGKQGLIWDAEERLYYRLYRDRRLEAAVYLAAGRLEESRFQSTGERLAELLEGRGYEGLRLEWRLYDDHGHSSIVGPGIRDGLKWVFEASGPAG